MNCNFFGDWPEDKAWCKTECRKLVPKHHRECKVLQRKSKRRPPWDVWCVVAEKGTVELWMEQNGVKKK